MRRSGGVHQRGFQAVHAAQVGEARMNDVRMCLVQPRERASVVQEEDEVRRRQGASSRRRIDLHASKAVGFKHPSLTSQ